MLTKGDSMPDRKALRPSVRLSIWILLLALITLCDLGLQWYYIRHDRRPPTYDDAWYLGGTPWEAPKNYHDEAAIYQITKIKTPTHIVGGSVDVRVYIGEQYLLERALQTVNVPHALLVFPGEGHSLSSNPWHGKIKVREELKWLDKYCPRGDAKTVSAGQD